MENKSIKKLKRCNIKYLNFLLDKFEVPEVKKILKDDKEKLHLLNLKINDFEGYVKYVESR